MVRARSSPCGHCLPAPACCPSLKAHPDATADAVIDEDMNGESPLGRVDVKKRAVRTVRKQVRTLQKKKGHREAEKLAGVLRKMMTL